MKSANETHLQKHDKHTKQLANVNR